MDISLEKWISELEMDEYDFIDQYQTNYNGFNYLDEFTPFVESTPMAEIDIQQSYSSSSESHTSSVPDSQNNKSPSSSTTIAITAAATTTTSTISAVTTQNASPNHPPSTIRISFSDGSSPVTSPSANPPRPLVNENKGKSLDPKDDRNDVVVAPNAGQKRPNSVIRTPLEAQDRVIAERKRREKLSQRFIALSAMVPGLKKMDKASVLGDAIKYFKQLQEHAKFLEEKINTRCEESVVFVKKSHISADDDTSSCDENFDGRLQEPLPEIEARISEKNVLIRIHCEKQKGFVVKLLSEIEKNHLTVVNSSFLPFGQYATDITVVAQMEEEFCMTVKDLVMNLRSVY